MALSNKERQEGLRARRLLLGMTEVRGIYLPPHLHAKVKDEAEKLLSTDAAHPKCDALGEPDERIELRCCLPLGHDGGHSYLIHLKERK